MSEERSLSCRLLAECVTLDCLEVEPPGTKEIDMTLEIVQGPSNAGFTYSSEQDTNSLGESKPSLAQCIRHLAEKLDSQHSVNEESDYEFLNLSQESNANNSLSDFNSVICNIPNSTFEIDSFLVPSIVPRSTTPFQGLSDLCEDLNSKLNPVTPTKPPSDEEEVDPLTPMANLKMLISAASPEIRNREEKKQREMETKSGLIEDKQELDIRECRDLGKSKPKKSDKRQCKDLDYGETFLPEGPTKSRKEKSLGLLCHRFLDMYPEYPAQYSQPEVCLDEVAKELNVERRRIYDIVNVLESVEIVSRKAKNRYTWHGKTNLANTLAKIKGLAISDGFMQYVQNLQESDNLMMTSTPSSSSWSRKREPLRYIDDSNLVDSSRYADFPVRKEKSLGIMSQKFLMLFLSSETTAVSLDLAAKILVGDQSADRVESAKFKTKIRRLYDIANILTSLGLIEKLQITGCRGKKPAFRYTGPTINCINQQNACSEDKQPRPSSKQSLLDCVQNPSYQSFVLPKPPSKRSFSRHASFEQICEVAELERNKLYFESSRSEPNSPLRSNRSTFKLKEGRPSGKLPRIESTGNCIKQVKIVEENNPVKPTNQINNDVGQLPLSSVEPKESNVSSSLLLKENITESKGSADSSLQGNTIHVRPETQNSKTTVITLTNEQLNALIKSKVIPPRTVSREQGPKYVDVATQSSPSLTGTLGNITKTEADYLEIKQNNADAKVSYQNIYPLSSGQMFQESASQRHKRQRSAKDSLVNSQPLKRFRSDNQIIQNDSLKNVSAENLYYQSNRNVDPGKKLPVRICSLGNNVVQAGCQSSLSSSRMHRPSPLRVLHLEPEFNGSSLTGPQSLKSSPGFATIGGFHEMDLASPLSDKIISSPGAGQFQYPDTNLNFSHISEYIDPCVFPSVSMANASAPTFRLATTSPPVMLLPSTTVPMATVTSNNNDRQGVGLVQPPSKPLKNYQTSREITPTTEGQSLYLAGLRFQFDSSRISPLHLLSDDSAPVVNSVSTATVATSLHSPPLITPTEPRLPSNIRPSSNNMVNLIPYFNSPSRNVDTKCQTLLIRSKQTSVDPPAMSTQTPLESRNIRQSSSPSDVFRTPVNLNTSIISPMENNKTPDGHLNRPLATPSSFFRGTPGGPAFTAVSMPMLVGTRTSAFEVVSQSMPNNFVIPTARRLPLTEEQSP